MFHLNLLRLCYEKTLLMKTTNLGVYYLMAWARVYPAVIDSQNLSRTEYQLIIVGYLFGMVFLYNLMNQRSY
jgi:hypothetical protein